MTTSATQVSNFWSESFLHAHIDCKIIFLFFFCFDYLILRKKKLSLQLILMYSKYIKELIGRVFFVGVKTSKYIDIKYLLVRQDIVFISTKKKKTVDLYWLYRRRIKRTVHLLITVWQGVLGGREQESVIQYFSYIDRGE